MEIVLRECSAYTWAPCTEKDWKQCYRCGKYVCEVHGDGLYCSLSLVLGNRCESSKKTSGPVA